MSLKSFKDKVNYYKHLFKSFGLLFLMFKAASILDRYHLIKDIQAFVEKKRIDIEESVYWRKTYMEVEDACKRNKIRLSSKYKHDITDLSLFHHKQNTTLDLDSAVCYYKTLPEIF